MAGSTGHAPEGVVETGMIPRSLAYAAAVACTASALPASAGSTEIRAVLELFTSQGCSSCPPADKLLAQLAEDPSLVPLSLPIDYWDYLGWKDTLADPRHSARQRAYSKVRGDHEVYTPQVVVNGSIHALGSDKSAIEMAIAKSRQNPETMVLPVDLSVAGDYLLLSVPERTDLHASAEIWVAGLVRAVSVTIKRGENNGKTITYHNVARSWRRLDSWHGEANRWTIRLQDIERNGIDEAAVFVQAGSTDKPTNVLGTAIAQLH
jgi:hypothetical protein